MILHLSSKFQPVRLCGSAVNRRTLRQTVTCFISIDLGIGMYSIFMPHALLEFCFQLCFKGGTCNMRRDTSMVKIVTIRFNNR